jgi:competence protein ComEC
VSRRVLLAVGLLLGWLALPGAQAPLLVYFFDVGQGDAVLIQSPSGKAVLYDAGDSPDKIVSHLRSVGVTSLDLAIASHNHADHIGGMAEVLRRFSPRFYMDNGVPATTGTYRGVLAAAADAGVQLLEPTNRQVLLGNDVSLTVLPPAGIPGWEQNDNAIGAVLTYGKFRMSLAGDAEQRQWDWWGQHYPALLAHVQVHKASHHGSDHGDTARALLALSPEAVVISVGKNNLYQHPRPNVLQLYAERRSIVYRTDLNGTITVEAEPTGKFVVRVQRESGNRQPPVLDTSALSTRP